MAGAFRKYQSILFSYVVFWEESLPNSYQCLSLKGPFLTAASQTDRPKSINHQSVSQTNKQTNRKPFRWPVGVWVFPSPCLCFSGSIEWGHGAAGPWSSLQQARNFQSWIQSNIVDLRGLSCVLRFSFSSASWMGMQQQTWGEQRDPGGIFTVDLKLGGWMRWCMEVKRQRTDCRLSYI